MLRNYSLDLLTAFITYKVFVNALHFNGYLCGYARMNNVAKIAKNNKGAKALTMRICHPCRFGKGI